MAPRAIPPGLAKVDSPVPLPVVAAGRLLNHRYRIDGLLGGGGMSTVWRGRDLRLDRPVAIKELSGEGLSQPMALERFSREARAVGRLSHPNVVSVYDAGADDGQPYVVMELVEGRNVAALLADGPLPVADVLTIGSQVCDGLAAAHAAGVIHRDIKPANLILTADGVVKICDFGVARLLKPDANGNLTGPATAMGSPSYMAPEQINAGPVDPRTDLYALGCTMYAMLAGAPPFTTGGAFSIVQQHVSAPPPPLRARRPDLPAALESLVADLLAKSPDHRPPDALAVRARIAAVLADPAIAATPRVALSALASPPAVPSWTPAMIRIGTPPARPRRPGRRATTRRLWMVAALVGAAVIGAAVAGTILPMLRVDTGVHAARWNGPPAPPSTSLAPIAVAPPTTASSRAARSSVTPHTDPPSGSTPPSAPPPDPIVALRQTIAQQVAAGGLKSDAATDLSHMVDDLAHTIASGNAGDVTNKINALRAKLTTLNKEGKLSAAGYQALNGAVDQVAAGQG